MTLLKNELPGSIQQKSPAIIENNISDIKYPIIDIGANLTNKAFNSNLMQVLKSSYSNGVRNIMITGTSLRNSEAAIKLCKLYQNETMIPRLSATVGIHPHDAHTAKDIVKTKSRLLALIENNREHVVAVGECGLDYNRMFSTKQEQQLCFLMQLELAKQVNLPLFLHEREASDDFVKIIQNYDLPGVVHCFTGTRAEMKLYLDMGFYIGLTGFINDAKRAQEQREFICEIPPERLLIETDAPFMTPKNVHPRPKKNEPKYLPFVLHEISNVIGVEPERVAQCTTENAVKLFNLN
ncbi:hypothetical protein HDV04_005322 [Boothiomyces sp. JEL0838]|nr:hypothetical protein HDV04_005322 [Boothiomyces sp. JEL0838]